MQAKPFGKALQGDMFRIIERRLDIGIILQENFSHLPDLSGK